MARKFLTAVVAASLLSACGVTAGPALNKARSAAMTAKSYAGAAKGVRAMYLAAFKSADKDENGYLTLQEMMPALPTQVGQAPTEPARAAKALFDSLDLNKDGKIRFREFSAPPVLKAAVEVFRHQVGKTFAALDLNGDRVLVEAELAKSAITVDSGDRNKDGKLTISEFEDAFAATLGQGPEPVDPPSVEPPVPADPGAAEPPSEEPPAGDEP